jgi:oligopeptide/dipeptide ABC transporter ATP-binding protein
MYAGRVVERGSVDALYAHPTHPYTQGLLNSLPSVGLDRLQPIPGSPPNMMDPPSGCAFRVRCSHAIEKCALEMPTLRQLGDIEAACWRAEEVRKAVTS